MYRFFGDRLTIFEGQFKERVIIFNQRVIIFFKKVIIFENYDPDFRQQNIKVEKGADRMYINIPSCNGVRTITQSIDLKNFRSLTIFNKMKTRQL